MSIEERFELLNKCHNILSFLESLHAASKDDLLKSCKDLDIALPLEQNDQDVDGLQLYQEILCFRELFTEAKKPNEIVEKDLISSFPNLAIAIRIFCTLPVSVASCERSFSKLRLIKNYLRPSMSQ